MELINVLVIDFIECIGEGKKTFIQLPVHAYIDLKSLLFN